MQKPKLRTKIFASAVLSILSFFVLIAVFNQFLPDEVRAYAASLSAVPHRELETAVGADGFYYIKNDASGEPFKILQLTDLHIGGGTFSLRTDRKAIDAVYKLISHAKPDLIILTGDLVYPMPFRSGTFDNRRAARIVGALMESVSIPWTFVYGNHDAENFALRGKSALTSYFTGIENCLFQPGPEELTGQGNTFIKLLNGDGGIDMLLALLDSNAYVNGCLSGYDYIRDDQVEWYAKTLTELSAGKPGGGLYDSLLYIHIPFNEYLDAWEKAENGGGEAELLAGEKHENVCAPETRGKIFDKITELGSTKAVFCGHDHLNYYSVLYKGVKLTYGRSIDYLAYAGGSDYQRGATLVTVNEGAAFGIESIALSDI